MSLILLFMATFAGAFFAAVAGFGFALISTPLLCLIIPTKEAIVLLPVLTVVLRIITMHYTWGKFDKKTVGTVLLGYFVGTLPGAYVLKIISVAQLQVMLGIILMLVTTLMAKKYSVTIKNKFFGRATAGMLGSMLGAATSVNGPPIILYFLNEKVEKNVMRANLIWIFGIGSVANIIGNLVMGNMKEVSDWNHLKVMIPAVIIATYFGEKCFGKIDQQLFYRIALGAVFLGGTSMMLQGLFKILG